MTPLPPPPPEVPAVNSLDGLAPKFLAAVQQVQGDLTAKSWRPVFRETTRTDERAAWLFGFGREYDDGRGVVTNAATALKTWHHYGLAVDFGDKRYGAGEEPAEFWQALKSCAEARGLVSGAAWSMRDNPHVQWGAPMRVSPSDEAARLLASDGGVEAVWRAVGAMDEEAAS